MIERPGLDKDKLFTELVEEFGGRELIEIDREEILKVDEDAFADWEDPDWAADLGAFFKMIVQYPAIGGVSFSSELNKEVHVDYFCNGDNGVEMSAVINGIDLVRYSVGNPVGSIQWFGRDRSFEDATRRFRASLSIEHHNRELLMLIRFV